MRGSTAPICTCSATRPRSCLARAQCAPCQPTRISRWRSSTSHTAAPADDSSGYVPVGVIEALKKVVVSAVILNVHVQRFDNVLHAADLGFDAFHIGGKVAQFDVRRR